MEEVLVLFPLCTALTRSWGEESGRSLDAIFIEPSSFSNMISHRGKAMAILSIASGPRANKIKH